MTDQTKTISIAALSIVILAMMLVFIGIAATAHPSQSRAYPPALVVFDDGSHKVYQNGLVPEADLQRVPLYRLGNEFAHDMQKMYAEYRTNLGTDDRAAEKYRQAYQMAMKGFCVIARDIGRQNMPPSGAAVKCEQLTEADLKLD